MEVEFIEKAILTKNSADALPKRPDTMMMMLNYYANIDPQSLSAHYTL